MSPSWRNRLYLAISPDRVSLIKLGRAWKPNLLAKHDESVAPVGKAVWQQSLDKVSEMLGQAEWQNAEVDVVLSNRLVRYAIVPFNAQLQSYAEQKAYAGHYLSHAYGDDAVRWEIRIQQGKPDGKRLVSAVDSMLLDGLRQACARHKLKLRSVTPWLMQEFNRHSRKIKADPAWFVLKEPGYSLFVLLSEGELATVNGVSHGSIRELPLLLDRENLAASLAEPCKAVYLDAPWENEQAAIPKMGYEFNKLFTPAPAGFPSSAEGLYPMVMSAISK